MATDQEYFRERQAFHSATYNRILLTLSGGALALSVTFIGQLTESPNAKWLVALGWSALVAAVALVVRSHYLSAQAFSAAYFEKTAKQGSDYTNLGLRSKKAAARAGAFFAIGLALLAAFAYINL